MFFKQIRIDTRSHFRFDVTLSRWRPYDVISHRKELPLGECTAHMQQRPPVPDDP